jgi:hypothetical protein
MSLYFKSINPGDVTCSPFKAHKSWEYSTSQSFDELQHAGIKFLEGLKPTTAVYTNGVINISTQQHLEDPSCQYINDFDSSYLGVDWYGINNKYFKNHKNINDEYLGEVGGPTINNNDLHLYENVSIISIPTDKIGEGIEKNSFVCSYDYNGSHNLYDDGKGYIIDTALYSGSITQSIDSEIIKLIPQTLVNETSYNTLANCTSFIMVVPVCNNISYNNGSYVFNINSYIKFKDDSNLCNLTLQDNFTIVFSNIYISPQECTLLAKNFNTDTNTLTNQAPFKVSLKKVDSMISTIVFECGTASISYNIMSIGTYNIICKKEGINISLYIDGNLCCTTTINPNMQIHNNNMIYIGCNGNSTNHYIGNIGGFHLFKKALNDEEINYISFKNSINNIKVGRIDYNTGIIMITDPRTAYKKLFKKFTKDINGTQQLLNTAQSDINIKWRSTITIYENEVLVRLRQDEFTFTMNPSIRVNKSLDSDLVSVAYTQDKTWTPYITTIGLYNDVGQLLVVATLAHPIKKRDDVDISFLLRFDM